MRVVDRKAIEQAVHELDLIPLIEEGFVAYSGGRAVVPPVGELVLPDGEFHIKYGFITGGSHCVVKIASGFYGNPARGLPSSNGMMLAFRQDTGEPAAVLLDEGHLTDVRTAVAGAIAARRLGPSTVRRIGIVGTGIQARLQLAHLGAVTPCRDVVLWGRREQARSACQQDMRAQGFDVTTTEDVAELGRTCNLIVTTTPSPEPIVLATHLRPGTHVSAMGSDAPHKQELEAKALARADVVVADSRAQCKLRGEIARALEAGTITDDDVVEIGDVISGKSPGRTSDRQITVFDSTGVAVQDIQIALGVLKAVEEGTA